MTPVTVYLAFLLIGTVHSWCVWGDKTNVLHFLMLLKVCVTGIILSVFYLHFIFVI